jgi:hypothetical protein
MHDDWQSPQIVEGKFHNERKEPSLLVAVHRVAERGVAVASS